MKMNKKRLTSGKEENNQDVQVQFNNYFRNSAVGIFLLGAIHLVIPSLDIYWGILLIALGIFSFFVRKKSTILIFGVVLVLAGAFNGLALFLGYVDPSNIRWALFGIVQLYWGISEIVKYFKLRKLKLITKTNKIIEICGYIVLVLVFVFYIYMSWFYVPEYTLLKDVNGKQIEIPASECAEPYVENWDRCCIPHQNDTWLCEDEGEDYDKKFDLALAGNLTYDKIIRNQELKMSFESPPDYLLIKDTKEGGIPVPYIFVSDLYKGENYTGDSLYITFIDFRKNNFTSEDWKYVINSFVDEYSEYEINESQNAKGYEISITERAYPSKKTNEIVYEKSVLFLDYSLRVMFESVGSGKDYVYEFDRLIDSIQFDD